MTVLTTDRDRIYRAQLLRVVDGDTMDVMIDQGFDNSRRERLRLFGIDTPESFGVKKDSEEYKAGIAAKNFVEASVFVGGTVWLRTLKTGKYGRYLALVWAEQQHVDDLSMSINAQLVKSGHAELYVNDPLPVDDA
jgi:micrococcal nuclease